MRPSSLLRGLCWELMHPSSKVAPLQERHSFTCRDAKRPENKIDGKLLLNSVACSVKEQKSVVDTISGPNSDICDRISIEEYLDESVDLLDVCKFILGKIELVKSYVDSVRRGLELIQSGTRPGASTRVKGLLEGEKCKGDVSMGKCWSRLKKLAANEKRRRREDGDFLIRSTVNAFDVCARLDKALSFNKRRLMGFSVGGSTEQMVELRDVIASAKKLQDPTVEDAGGAAYGGHVEELGKRCEKLVGAVGPLEERVKELYSQLVRVRVALLELLSKAKEFKINIKSSHYQMVLVIPSYLVFVLSYFRINVSGVKADQLPLRMLLHSIATSR